MEQRRVACMYYPTTVVVVDDNPTVLENIQLKIGKLAPCKTFSVPEQALDYLQKNIARNKSLKGIVSVDEESNSYRYDSEQLPLQYNVTNIHKHVYSKDRFSEVSVVIVDYAMPSMNGEEFCKKLRQIKGSMVKIIMLTGEADDPKAIQLFNAGIIDRFLRKAQQEVEEDLKDCIFEMQSNYFKTITYPIVQALMSEEESSIGDPAFTDLFDKICHDISATSYYLIETSGSFMFFNNAGKPTWLIIKTLNELKEISSQIEAHIAEELVHSIKRGEVVPYFRSLEIDCYSDEGELRKSLHKAKKLKGKKTYCYALIDKLPKFPLKRKSITSFDQFVSGL